MASDMKNHKNNIDKPSPLLLSEIGPDGLLRESSVISYTEQIIEKEQLQLRKYIEENYSKIRDVEKEFTNLNLEMKLTAGPKKAALEHMRKKIELSTEKILLAKVKVEQAQKAWEEASKAVKDEEAVKQKLCEDLNGLVQESSKSQFARLEELKRRLEALNPSRSSNSVPYDGNPVVPVTCATTTVPASAHTLFDHTCESPGSLSNEGNASLPYSQQPRADGIGMKKKVIIHGRGKGVGAVPKGRGSSSPGWTGAGFDVDSRTS